MPWRRESYCAGVNSGLSYEFGVACEVSKRVYWQVVGIVGHLIFSPVRKDGWVMLLGFFCGFVTRTLSLGFIKL